MVPDACAPYRGANHPLVHERGVGCVCLPRACATQRVSGRTRHAAVGSVKILSTQGYGGVVVRFEFSNNHPIPPVYAPSTNNAVVKRANPKKLDT